MYECSVLNIFNLNKAWKSNISYLLVTNSLHERLKLNWLD